MTALRAARGAGQEVFEVTALVNSLLGLLVFPQQRFVDAIPETPLEQLALQGWPVPRVDRAFEQVRDLRQPIRYLRNTVAHFNIKFTANSQGEIAGVIVWNHSRRGQKNWQAKLSVVELERIVDRFARVLEEHQLVPQRRPDESPGAGQPNE